MDANVQELIEAARALQLRAMGCVSTLGAMPIEKPVELVYLNRVHKAIRALEQDKDVAIIQKILEDVRGIEKAQDGQGGVYFFPGKADGFQLLIRVLEEWLEAEKRGAHGVVEQRVVAG